MKDLGSSHIYFLFILHNFCYLHNDNENICIMFYNNKCSYVRYLNSVQYRSDSELS